MSHYGRKQSLPHYANRAQFGHGFTVLATSENIDNFIASGIETY